MKKPTYTFERQYTRNGNPMQRYQIFEHSDKFLSNEMGYKHRIAVVFELRDAKQITELLNQLPNGLQSWNDQVTWYQQNKPEQLRPEYRS